MKKLEESLAWLGGELSYFSDDETYKCNIHLFFQELKQRI